MSTIKVANDIYRAKLTMNGQ